MEKSNKSHGQRKSLVHLDADVLSIIFHLNTLPDDSFTVGDEDYDDTSDRSLITARFTSQVCRLWRYIMLSLPGIWADSLNFKYLEQKNDNWRKEVLKRTGTAPLSIIARDMKNFHVGRVLFLSLLKNESGRIRRIHTSTNASAERISHDSAWISLFLQDAPKLEIVSFRAHYGTNADLSSVVLFNNQQTKIHTFILHGPFRVSLPGPWNANIRHLEIMNRCIVHSLIPALTRMPQLESLHLVGCEIIPNTEQETSATIPNMRHFHFHNSINAAAAILDLIPPTIDGSTSITISDRVDVSLPVELVSRLDKGIIQHMQVAFCKELSLNICDLYMELTNGLPIPGFAPIKPTFSIGKLFYPYFIPCQILDNLSDGAARTITHLDISINVSEAKKSRNETFKTSLPRLLQSMHSLEVLHTRMNDISFLTELLHTPAVCFTRLHKLVLKPQNRSISMELVDFIEKRRSVGFPLSKIEIKRCDFDDKKALQYLNGSGLILKWTL